MDRTAGNTCGWDTALPLELLGLYEVPIAAVTNGHK